jgi:glutamate-ammonia-ligase adenylyltransferase
VPTPSDLFLSPDLTEEQAREYLASLGFRDAVAADTHLQAMAEDLSVREALGRVAPDLLPALLESPDPDAAVVGLSRYIGARTGRSMFLDYLREDPRALHVLTYVLGASPFLGEILIRNPEYFHWLVSQFERSAPDRQDLEDEIHAQLSTIDDPAEALDVLKRWKRRETLRIAARDLMRRETVETATAQISDLASVVVDTALAIVMHQLLAAEGREAAPGAFAVIGMGKLGGRELNYSSDIDLIYVYDTPDGDPSAGSGSRAELTDDSSARDFFHRLGRKLTAALGDYTGESYLYRVDLRLRPGGAKGNIAYSLDEYDEYYTAWGETFERFALIKARPIAGDAQLSRRFIDRVQPFVYRKYLDRAALEELSRYKARSDQALGTRADDRNVKAGRGGIREIELFTQVFQLSYGGQNPSLRQASTLAGLEALVRAGLVSKPVQHDLTHAYVFLRSVEHRLQLVQENQTHRMSDQPQELEISARRLGLGSSEDLAKQLREYRDRVHAIYGGLFEHRKDSSDFEARQLFRILNNEVPPSEAVTYLESCGLPEGKAVLDRMLSMNQSAASAQAPAVARNVVANLLAVLMPRLVECAKPEQVLTRLEQLAAATGGPIHFYRSLLEHLALQEAVILVLDSGDLPAMRLIRYPELLDSLILPPEDIDTAGRKIASALDWREDLDEESRMSQVRRLKAVEEFKMVFEWLAGSNIDVLQEKLSTLAELCVERAARWHAPQSLERESWAIMALGKLGGIELGVHSDLDLVVFYEGDPEDGRTFEQYQAFVTAMTTFLDRPTSEGTVYHVDTRLRPEGRKGALAIPVSMFQRYLETRAEPWERLAWTRCRPLAAPPEMSDRIQNLVTGFVYGPWDPKMPHTMRDVRARMERELAHEDGRRLDFKVGKGGLADIDFMLQLIQIREGHRRPEFRIPGTRRLLASLPETAYLQSGEIDLLRTAHKFLRALELMARMDTDTNLSWISSDPLVIAPLAVRMGFARPSAGEQLLDKYRNTTAIVRKLYLQVLERL